jgi:hypothetical protein
VVSKRDQATQRNRSRNEAMLGEIEKVFRALTGAGFKAVKVNAPLWEKQESGQWALVGCTCGRTPCSKPGCNDPAHCHSVGKHPVGKGWETLGTDDWRIARQWLREGFNLGAYAPPAARVIAIDIDTPGLEETIYPDGIPQTVCDTIGGKTHVFHTLPDGFNIDDVPKVFEGGEVCVDGSRHLVFPLGLHPNGKRKWNGVDQVTVIPISTLVWLAQNRRQQKDKQEAAHGPADDGWKIKMGGRHPWLASQAGKLRNILASHAMLEAALLDLNKQRCEPPVAEDDIKRLAKTWWEKKEGMPPPGAGINLDGLKSKTLDSFSMRPVKWLWRNWLPMEEPVFIEGMSAVGKSTFVMDIVARLTQGDTMPDGSPHPTGSGMDIVYITTEDDPERVLLPRAIASGADPSRIRFVTGVFTMPNDKDSLLTLVKAHPDVGLVFIDPLFSHIGSSKDGKVLNTNSDAEMRTQIMQPLRDICRETGVMILLARHLNKAAGTDINTRGSGSYGGLTGASRGVIYVGKDPNDESGDLKVVGPLKSQYARTPNGLRFSTWSRTVHDNDGNPYETAVVEWETPLDKTVESYLGDADAPASKRAGSRRDDLDDMIRAMLSDKCVLSDTLEQAGLRMGCGEQMIKVARKRVGVVAHRHGLGPWHARLDGVVCSVVKTQADEDRSRAGSIWEKTEGDDHKVPRPRAREAPEESSPSSSSSPLKGTVQNGLEDIRAEGDEEDEESDLRALTRARGTTKVNGSDGYIFPSVACKDASRGHQRDGSWKRVGMAAGLTCVACHVN